MRPAPFVFRFLHAVRDSGRIAELSGREMSVLLVLLSRADGDDGTAYPSVQELVTACGMKERNVQKARAGLQGKGLLVVVGGGGRGRALVCKLLIPTAQETPSVACALSDDETPSTADTVSEETPSVADVNPVHCGRKTPSVACAPTDHVTDQNRSLGASAPKSQSENLFHPEETESRITSQLRTSSPHSAAPPSPPAKINGHTRAPDALWDCVAGIWFGGAVAKPDASRVGRIVRALRDHSATPPEIHRRLAAYRSAWPKAEATPEALLKHWARFAAPSASAGIDTETELRFVQHLTGAHATQFTPEQRARYDAWAAANPLTPITETAQ